MIKKDNERKREGYLYAERVNVSPPLFLFLRGDVIVFPRRTRDVIEFFHSAVSWKKVENGVPVPLLKTLPDDSCQSRYTRLYRYKVPLSELQWVDTRVDFR